jgi:hypothetical protein
MILLADHLIRTSPSFVHLTEKEREEVQSFFGEEATTCLIKDDHEEDDVGLLF